jgi:hypothetical protein
MRSKLIVESMLANGMLDSTRHNPNDFITYTTKATKQLEVSLADVKQHENVADLVAAMFDSGFCTAEAQADPNEWIMFAEAAIAELKVV